MKHHCPHCGGVGQVMPPPPVPPGVPFHMVIRPVTCHTCEGSGWVEDGMPNPYRPTTPPNSNNKHRNQH
jgi:DnaJ-class molecular chaperone